MLGDFLRSNKLIHPVFYSDIIDGTPIVALCPNRPLFLQFGIYLGGSVIIQEYHNRSYLGRIRSIPFREFYDYGRGYLYEYVPSFAYDRSKCVYRALDGWRFSSIEGIRSIFGDDFVFYCMVGSDGFCSAFDNSKMGYHYVEERRKFIRYEHHAIAIEQNFVIHFNRHQGETCKPYISLDPFDDLKKPFKVVYEHEDFKNRLETRNKALLVFAGSERFKEYNLFQNNCEHFARWCKTGEHKSKQVTSGMIDIGILIASILAKLPNPYLVKILKRFI